MTDIFNQPEANFPSENQSSNSYANQNSGLGGSGNSRPLQTDNEPSATSASAAMTTSQTEEEPPTETINVKIMGYNQKLTCRAGEAAIFEEAARKVEASILELRKNVPSFSLERVAILTALDIYHELLLKDLQLEEFSNIVKSRSAKIKDLLAKIEGAY